jgi:hypothetical protein
MANENFMAVAAFDHGAVPQAHKFFDPKAAETVLETAIPMVDLFQDEDIPRFAGSQTSTKLALSAIKQLEQVERSPLDEALIAIENVRDVSAQDLLDFLEEKTKFTEVLGEFAEGWSVSTRSNFSQLFGSFKAPNSSMDSIVSIAILNDPDLERQLHIENTPKITGQTLLENRRIVWQWPAPGTPLDPPYVVLVAVEREDTTSAEDVVRSIMDQLESYKGVKLPKAVVQKLTGTGASARIAPEVVDFVGSRLAQPNLDLLRNVNLGG